MKHGAFNVILKLSVKSVGCDFTSTKKSMFKKI